MTTSPARDLLDELRRDAAALAELRRLVGPPAAYTCATLAAELGVTPRAIRAAVERGELAAVKRGRVWVIGADAVAAWALPGKRRARTSPGRPRAVLRF